MQTTTAETSGRASTRAPVKTTIPDGFGISDRTAEWATRNGHLTSFLVECLDEFISSAKANGRKYADWDEAFMNAVRKDWAKIGDGRRRVAL